MMEQFRRVVEVNVGGKTFRSKDLYIEFDVPFDDDASPNESVIRIYNLTQDTISRIKRNDVLTINAGYEGDVGLLLSGRVSYVSTRKDGPDKVTSIYVLDSSDLSGVKLEKRAYAAGVTGQAILRDLVPLLKVPIAAFRLPKNKTYAKGYTVTGSIIDHIEEVAKDCGAACYMNRGKLYIRPITDGDDARFVLRNDTGLVGSPERFEDSDGVKGYHIECLLQHRITTASIIDLESKFVRGRFRVRRGRHVCNMDTFLTTAEVIESAGR
jgi:hypothetical protein